MITKGIIEEVNSKIVNEILLYQYTVRLPIFHGYGESNITPTNQLPKAVYCTPPHMNNTKLCKGDIVYVAIEDFDLSSIVILGLIPIASTTGLAGAEQTQSEMVLEQVQTLTTNLNANVRLPYDTIIFTDTDENPKGRNFVNGDELSYLKYVDAPIQEQLTSIQNTVTSMSDKFDIKATLGDVFNIDNIALDSSTWIRRSGFTTPDFAYTFTKGTNWTVTDSYGVIHSYTYDQLSTLCGITYNVAITNSKFTVLVTTEPLPIRYGGTGADEAGDARKNLSVYKTVVISQSNFDILKKNNNLEARTTYYIYTS